MIVGTENLKYALTVVGNTYNRNVHQDALRCVLFEVAEDRVSIATTDLAGSSCLTIPCVAKKEQSFLVGFESIRDFVKLIKTDTIEFKIGAKVALVAEGYPKLNLPTVDVKLFPKIKRPDSVSFTLSFAELHSALSCSGFVDAMRVPLTGIHLSERIIEAADGFVGKRTLGEFNFPEMVLPVSIEKMLSIFKSEEFVNVTVDNTSVTFLGDSWFFRYLKISGTYPDVSVAYRNSNQTILEMNRSELELTLSALKIAGDTLTVSIDYDTITFDVSGETSTSHTIQVEGKTYLPNEAIVSILWLTKILKACKGDIVTIYIGERKQPIIIEDGENTQFFMLQWNS